MQLEVRSINKSFGTNHVLKDITFTAQSGSAFGLLGRNGSGKTTTIRIIMNIFSGDSGEVFIDGQPNDRSTRRIGYLPEERGLYPKRIISEQMAYFGELRGLTAKDARKRSEYLLERLEAGEFYKKRLDTLSKGNQQKIQLAIALINDPEIVILDEPFSGLDPVNAKILKDLVSELVKQGKMVLFSSHQMSNVEEFCDDLCIINHGEIVLEGNLNTIKRNYPRNRILVTPEDLRGDVLIEFMNRNTAVSGLMDSCVPHKDGCIVSLKDAQDKRKLMAILAESDIRVDSFLVVEPTLEDIFVEKAGDLQ